jgi:hypothetical protein
MLVRGWRLGAELASARWALDVSGANGTIAGQVRAWEALGRRRWALLEQIEWIVLRGWRSSNTRADRSEVTGTKVAEAVAVALGRPLSARELVALTIVVGAQRPIKERGQDRVVRNLDAEEAARGVAKKRQQGAAALKVAHDDLEEFDTLVRGFCAAFGLHL